MARLTPISSSPPKPDVYVPHKLVIEPPSRWTSLELRELWQHRDLLFFLTWRDLSVRYKQTILGPIWAVMNPVASMLIFSLFLGGLVGVASDGVPYPLFSFAALVPWVLFTNTLNRTAVSLVGSAGLITKVYFPRLIIPLSNVLSSLVDFGLSFAVLVILMLAYGYLPTLNILLLPFFVLLCVMIGLGVGLILAAMNVRFRDVGLFMPFFLQAWLYATPVVYSSSLVQGDLLRTIYNLNPMVSVVEGFRWSLLGVGNPPGATLLLPIALAIVALVCGVFYFKQTERIFTDVV
jgi:lipopolysaccharide transport system permease protein